IGRSCPQAGLEPVAEPRHVRSLGRELRERRPCGGAERGNAGYILRPCPRSWPPPLISGSGHGPIASRRMSAPTPFRAPILCPETVIRSAPSVLILQGILP